MMHTNWSSDYLGQHILNEIIPSDAREAVKQGVLFVHSLAGYFRAELSLLDYRNIVPVDGSDVMLSFVSRIKQDFSKNVSLLFPHFDSDFGFLTARIWPEDNHLEKLLSTLFDHFCQEPRYEVTLNLGDDTSEEGRRLTGLILRVLARQHTRLEPQIVFRVKQGVNLRPGDANFDLLMLALEIARSRKGIAFSIMDSALNDQWVNLVSYTVHGLRIEPAACDLFMGCRGHIMPCKASLNIPLLESYGDERLLSTLGIAARLLAHRLEIIQNSPSNRGLPVILNLAGLPADRSAFERLSWITEKVSRLREEYDCNILLAATAEEVLFEYSSDTRPRKLMNPLLAASLHHMLPGGHCYLANAGAHRTVSELHQELVEAVQAGVSFLRFEVDDTRCAACAIPVAALGACPSCGSESRRTLIYNGTRLEECMRSVEHPKGSSLFWLPS